MNLVIIIGPHAVGKMTIGQELAKISGFKLFHNHMTIDLVSNFFSYSTPQGRRLVNRIRNEFFNAFAESDEKGFIFTFVWAFGEPGEQEYIEGIAQIFQNVGATVFWVELEASLEERLKRNRSENRLRHKPSKRDVSFSEKNLIETHERYRLNSLAGEISQPRYLRVDTTNICPQDVAMKIWCELINTS